MKTILDIINLSADYLQKKGIASPRRQAEELVAEALEIKRIDLYLQFERPLINSELDLCRQWLQRRGQREPLQYIRGCVEFYHCKVKLSPAVLIPRHETEILVDKIAATLKKEDVKGKVLLDLCCGSGCMGIALKKSFPDLEVYLSDLSAEALAVAKENAEANEVQVNFLSGDLLAPFNGKKADYLVCNPPYLTDKEFIAAEQEVRDFEPIGALVAGKTGIEFYQRLEAEMAPFLQPEAKVWFEIGTGQGESLLSIFDAPKWKNVAVEKDWSGHDRFFFVEI